jgi:hypothetical protein
MNSVSSTDRPSAGKDAGLQPWHFFLLLAMFGATVAVVRARDTHPASLILISAAVIASGLVAVAGYNALAGFFGGPKAVATTSLSESVRQTLEAEKALVLRSIKELEFDRAMRKVSDADFAEISGRLRARALDLLEQLESRGGPSVPRDPRTFQAAPVARLAAVKGKCASCDTVNDADARFCKNCGGQLA